MQTSRGKLLTVKSKKWYGRFWPPERRKVKLMQAIVDYQTPKIEEKVNKAMKDYLLYGIKPDFTKQEVDKEDNQS